MSVVNSRLTKAANPVTEDDIGRRTYQVTWEVITDDEADDGGIVLTQARALVASATVHPVPERGDHYVYPNPELGGSGQSIDLGSFATRFGANRPNPETKPLNWLVTVNYQPPRNGQSQQQIQQPDPIQWPTTYNITWVEEQAEQRQGKNVADLGHIGRPADTEGPLVNAAGQPFDFPVMVTRYQPLITIRKNYATLAEINTVNDTYQGTVNSTTWEGYAPRTAKFLTCEAGQEQQHPVSAARYYPGTTRVQIDVDEWDLIIPNTGLKCFPLKNQDGVKTLQDCRVWDEVAEGFAQATEPMFLTPTGTQQDCDLPPLNIVYRYLSEVSYAPLL